VWTSLFATHGFDKTTLTALTVYHAAAECPQRTTKSENTYRSLKLAATSVPHVLLRLPLCRVSHCLPPLTTSLRHLPKPIVCTHVSSLSNRLLILDPVDYVDLPTIDLANFKSASAEDRALLATQVRDALLTHGFFYVIGHGYHQSEARPSSSSCYSDD